MENEGNSTNTVQAIYKSELEEIKNELKAISLSIKQLEDSILDPVSVTDIVDEITENLNLINNGIDLNSAEFSIDYDNRVVLDNVDCDFGDIEDDIIATIHAKFVGKTIKEG